MRQLLKFIDEKIICINKAKSNCEKKIRLDFMNKKGISTSYYLSDKYFQQVNFDENYTLKELGLEEN